MQRFKDASEKRRFHQTTISGQETNITGDPIRGGPSIDSEVLRMQANTFINSKKSFGSSALRFDQQNRSDNKQKQLPGPG